MLNFLKKALQPKVNEQLVIAEIHNEFDTAGERLLDEAGSIIAGKHFNYKKASRLFELGFINSKETDGIDNFNDVKELPLLIMGYQQKYPNNKFITHDVVMTICKKYNLLLGEIAMYKGEVPDRKLTEIENFKLKEEDKIAAFVTGDNDEIIYTLFEKDFNTDWTKSNLRSKTTFHVSVDYEFRKNVTTKHHRFAKVNYELTGLKICAPINQMIIPEGKIVKNNRVINIPDPIVLQPVKGGYLIVSKWGLEATDNLLTNEKLN